MSTIKYPNIKVRLAGMEGDAFFHAFAIVGRVSQALRRGGVSVEECDAYIAESKRGDYYQLLATAMAWVSCDEDDDDDS